MSPSAQNQGLQSPGSGQPPGSQAVASVPEPNRSQALTVRDDIDPQLLLKALNQLTISGSNSATFSNGQFRVSNKSFWKGFERILKEDEDKKGKAPSHEELDKILFGMVDSYLSTKAERALVDTKEVDLEKEVQQELVVGLVAQLRGGSPEAFREKTNASRVYLQVVAPETPRSTQSAQEMSQTLDLLGTGKVETFEGLKIQLETFLRNAVPKRGKRIDTLIGGEKLARYLISYLDKKSEQIRAFIRLRCAIVKGDAEEQIGKQEKELEVFNTSMRKAYIAWVPAVAFGPDHIEIDGMTLPQILRNIIPSDELIAEQMVVFGENFLERFHQNERGERKANPQEVVYQFFLACTKSKRDLQPEGDLQDFTCRFCEKMMAKHSQAEDSAILDAQNSPPACLMAKERQKELEKWQAVIGNRIVMGGRFQEFRNQTPLVDLLKGLSFSFSVVRTNVEEICLKKLACRNEEVGFKTVMDRKDFRARFVVDEVRHLGEKRLVIWQYRRYFIRHNGPLESSSVKERIKKKKQISPRKQSCPRLDLASVASKSSSSRSGPLPKISRSSEELSSLAAGDSWGGTNQRKLSTMRPLPVRGPLLCINEMMNVPITWHQDVNERDYGSYIVAVGIYPPVEPGGEWGLEYALPDLRFPDDQQLWISKEIQSIFEGIDPSLLKQCGRTQGKK